MDILDSIGKTPMQKIEGIFVKLEYLNPSGSVKDRIAKYIVEKAEKRGLLKNGFSIVEATTGNTGIAFSFVAAIKGYKMVVVMPRGMSRERMQIMKALGAKVILVKKDCVKCAVEYARKLSRKPSYYMPSQFENEWNVEEHRNGMGKEILQSMKNIECFVAGVGTGGTLIGCGSAIREKFPKARLVAVEPLECAILSDSLYERHNISGFHKGYTCRHHSIEGIGDGFIPKIVKKNRGIINEVVQISSRDAIREMKRLCKMGYLVGPSSGANFLAARRLAKTHKNVVTVFPDRAERYLSEFF